MDFTNIFSTYLYIKKCNINLSSLSNHINKTKKIDRKGAQISNYGGWQSKNFGETNSYTKPLFNDFTNSGLSSAHIGVVKYSFLSIT